jgi:TldD protein
MRILRFVLLLLPMTVATPATAQPPRKADRPTVLDAMVAELDRSMARLRLPGFEPPYFIGYTIREYDSVDLTAKFGALVGDERSRTRQAYVEVRVGEYQFDNTADAPIEGAWDPTSDALYEPGSDIPIDDDPQAIRGLLWLLTDARYKAALSALHLKRGHRATTVVEDESVASFARAPKVVYSERPKTLRVDRALWAGRVRRASAAFKKHPDLFDSTVRVQVTNEQRTLITSEGTRVVTSRVIWGLHATALTRAPDGMVLEHGKSWYGENEKELPGDKELLAAVDRVAGELEALRVAPNIDPYTGPAILMEEATGVLFHEVVGHRLEGERLGDDSEGHTFKGQIGHRVVPVFLDVVDDPTLRSQAGLTLNGGYAYDDEGVAAQAVKLVEKGVLRSYLTSRRPVSGVSRSNGHGRAEGNQDPMARMSNLVVSSSKQVSSVALKKLLLEEVRRQGKPFGLIIRDITGGSTNTTSYGYQAFKGTPRLVYKVDAKTGAETLVRGVELVGTPLTSINKIVATSDTVGVFNGYCGAESGYVPVSTVAPAVLLSEIELQRSQGTKQKPTVIPPPWR